jgi:uncharacterized membrane protein
MTYATSMDIEATAETVWSVLTDVERWPAWTASVTRVQRLDHGPFGSGSRARVKQPKLPTTVWTVTDVEPARSFTWTTRAGGVTSIGVHQIIPGPGRTVTVHLSVRQIGLLAPVVGLFAAGLTRRYIQIEAEGLKRYCETGSVASAA